MSALDSLRFYAASSGVDAKRIDEMIETLVDASAKLDVPVESLAFSALCALEAASLQETFRVTSSMLGILKDTPRY